MKEWIADERIINPQDWVGFITVRCGINPVDRVVIAGMRGKWPQAIAISQGIDPNEIERQFQKVTASNQVQSVALIAWHTDHLGTVVDTVSPLLGDLSMRRYRLTDDGISQWANDQWVIATSSTPPNALQPPLPTDPQPQSAEATDSDPAPASTPVADDPAPPPELLVDEEESVAAPVPPVVADSPDLDLFISDPNPPIQPPAPVMPVAFERSPARARVIEPDFAELDEVFPAISVAPESFLWRTDDLPDRQRRATRAPTGLPAKLNQVSSSDRSVTILVANTKGGSSKTTTSVLLASALGAAGLRCLLVDNNPAGNLDKRLVSKPLPHQTIDELALQLPSLEGSRSEVSRFIVHQPAGFDALAGRERKLVRDATGRPSLDRPTLSQPEVERIIRILGSQYPVVIIDAGNNIADAPFKAAVPFADLLVVPIRWHKDHCQDAITMLDTLAATGHPELAKNALLVETAPKRTKRWIRADWAKFFQSKGWQIHTLPIDPLLDTGNPIDWRSLRPRTQTSATSLAESVITQLITERKA